jgi:hypothetical protein
MARLNPKQKIQASFRAIINARKKNLPIQEFEEYTWFQFEKVMLAIYQENWNAMKRSHVAWNYMWADPTEEDRTFELRTEPIGQPVQTVIPIRQDQTNTSDIGAVTRMTPEQERKKDTIQGEVEAKMESEFEDDENGVS